jgi:hypothetical protein
MILMIQQPAITNIIEITMRDLETVGVVELSGKEHERLAATHPEIRQGESALVISAPRPLLSAIRDLARRVAWEEEQSERVLETLTADPEGRVLDETRVVQLQRQAEARERFLREFPTLGSQEIAELSGSTASNTAAQASRWKTAGKIFAVTVGRTDRYPAFQFGDDGKPLPIIADVIRTLGDRSSWALALWLVSHSGWLDGERPVDLLTSRPDAVLEAARRAVEPLDF